MAVFSDWPESRKPRVLNRVWPTMMAAMMHRMGTMYSMISDTSTIMPTETKKMAPKRSLTGVTTCSIRSASMVSARMLPMMNAPKAAENPTLAASTTMPKHNPSATMSIVSSLIRDRVFFRNRGIK